MLVITRKKGQRFIIGDAVVTIIECSRSTVKVGIVAPQAIVVRREELPNPIGKKGSSNVSKRSEN